MRNCSKNKNINKHSITVVKTHSSYRNALFRKWNVTQSDTLAFLRLTGQIQKNSKVSLITLIIENEKTKNEAMLTESLLVRNLNNYE